MELIEGRAHWGGLWYQRCRTF